MYPGYELAPGPPPPPRSVIAASPAVHRCRRRPQQPALASSRPPPSRWNGNPATHRYRAALFTGSRNSSVLASLSCGTAPLHSCNSSLHCYSISCALRSPAAACDIRLLRCYSVLSVVILSRHSATTSCHIVLLAPGRSSSSSRLARSWSGDGRGPANDNGHGPGARNSSVLQAARGSDQSSHGMTHDVACKTGILYRGSVTYDKRTKYDNYSVNTDPLDSWHTHSRSA